MHSIAMAMCSSARLDGAIRESMQMQYTFGAYVLDTQQCELYRDGIRLSLQLKAFQVLLYLLAHRERTVSRVELAILS